MSAFIVDEHHIAYMIHAAHALAFQPGHCGSPFRWVHHDAPGGPRIARLSDQDFGPDEVSFSTMGRILWGENLASVAARYPNDGSGERPGPCDLTDEEIRGFDWGRWSGCSWRPLDPVQVLDAISCYEYQSCETEGWRKSEAFAICEALRDAAIRALPRKDGRDWGAPEPINPPRALTHA